MQALKKHKFGSGNMSGFHFLSYVFLYFKIFQVNIYYRFDVMLIYKNIWFKFHVEAHSVKTWKENHGLNSHSWSMFEALPHCLPLASLLVSVSLISSYTKALQKVHGQTELTEDFILAQKIWNPCIVFSFLS